MDTRLKPALMLHLQHRSRLQVGSHASDPMEVENTFWGWRRNYLDDFSDLLCQRVQQTCFQEVLRFADSAIHVITVSRGKILWENNLNSDNSWQHTVAFEHSNKTGCINNKALLTHKSFRCRDWTYALYNSGRDWNLWREWQNTQQGDDKR